jgi:THO complex subunit 3
MHFPLASLPYCMIDPLIRIVNQHIVASTAMFNHVGDGVIMTHHQEHTIRIMDYPSLTVRESPAAHVGGCVAVALDPRGR